MVGGDVEEPTVKTYTEIFEEQCPYFMSIGMTYDEFWYGEPDRVRFYRDAHIIQNKSRNQELWVLGQYFMCAIDAELNKKAKYPEKPFDIFPKTEAEKKAEAESQRRKIIDYFTDLKQRWDNGNNRQLNS